MVNPLFSVIIPNWNGLRHLPVCLAALQRQTYRPLEVIIVDNASADGSREWLAEHHPEVRVVALPTNQGFTGACNAGLMAARGDYLALLNNDTEADPNWLAELAQGFARYQRAGILASKLLLFSQRDTFHTAGDLFYTNGMPGNRGVWQKDVGQFEEGAVFGACGGAVAYRKELLAQIGLLDDDFFFSCEDVDLNWRAQLNGWQVYYIPRAVVYHHLSATGGGATASFYDGRNSICVLIKDVPDFVWREHGWQIVQKQCQLAWQALRAWRGKEARARLRGQIRGILSIPALLRKRKMIQSQRKVSDAYIRSILTLAKPEDRKRG